MAQLLEQYHKSVADLPDKLRDHLNEIGRVDAECKTKAQLTDEKMKRFLQDRRSLSRSEAETLHKEISALFAEMQRISDQKIRLAADAYELVDKHIRKLDDDASKLRASMRQKFMDAADKITSGADDSEVEAKRRKSTHRKDKKKETTAVKGVGEPAGPSTVLQPFLDGAPIVEMPVDPNEPTYCICHQVSFGEMVMCDNKQCPIEWFHFQCVGLTEPPKGKWFCERCNELRKKKTTTAPKKH